MALKTTGDKHVAGPWLAERLGMVWVGRSMRAFATYEPELGPCGLRGGFLLEAYTRPGGSVLTHVASDLTRRWLTRDILYVVSDFCFNILKVKKILGVVNSVDTSTIAFDEKLGFVQEAVIRDMYPNGDGVIMSMYRHQCRWLREEHQPALLRKVA